MTHEEIKREIEFLKHILNYYDFEQNHILADYMPRIILAVTLDIAVFIAALNLGYLLLGSLIFAAGIFGMVMRSLQLKKDRDKILFKRLRVVAEISRRYELLGINVKRFWEM